MKPLLLPIPVNGPFEDPVLYVDFLFEKRALLFDPGNLRRLPPRKLLRVSDVFVSHTHMDHFQDFDWLLRLFLGRQRELRISGPPGFLDRLEHRLRAYTWNVAPRYEADLVLTVTELHEGERGRRAVFRLREGFARTQEEDLLLPGGILADDPALEVRAAVLDHGIPCLGFAAREKVHVNIWKTRLQELGLGTGRWLRDVRRAVLAGAPDETPIRAAWREGGVPRERDLTLGELRREAMQITSGQSIAYVVDVRPTAENADRIAELTRGADILFLEAAFLDEDAEQAAQKHHLTAGQAGRIAARAGVKSLVPIHFSPRYEGREEEVRAEALAAFQAARVPPPESLP